MNVRFAFFGNFAIYSDGRMCDIKHSEKRVALLKKIILQGDKGMAPRRLISELGMSGMNPDSALKTLISRTRAALNEITPGLGECIASEGGKYRWKNLPGLTVDVLEAIDLLDRLHAKPPANEVKALTEELMVVYTGELEDEYWLHQQFLEAVYHYIELLSESESYNRILDVCQRAIRVDELDEHLHILRMEALVNLDQTEEALKEYQKLVKLTEEYFDTEQSDELRESYTRLFKQSHALKLNLDAIHNELMQEERDQKGPYFCDYQAFKTIYNIQMRNIERLGSTMFLGVVMVESGSSAGREGAMAALQEVLRGNLRKGDIVTRFSENIVAMLLPSVNYSTGSVVMERIETAFFAVYPAGIVTLHSRVSPLY